VIEITSAQIVELENSAKIVESFDYIKNYLPVLLWALWLLVGTVFYAIHDDFGWAIGFYMSVNVGWSMGWSIPMSTKAYNTAFSLLFSIFHASFGVVFVGVAVIYMAQQLTANKDSWTLQIMKKARLEAASETEGYMDDLIAGFHFYFPKFKIILLFIFWLAAGLVWFTYSVETFNSTEAADYVLSSLSGGGYKVIPNGSSDWKFVIAALYAAVGVPLMAISLGLMLSLIMEAPDDQTIYEKIVANVTEEEIDFMKIFGIDDGDGTIDNREFIILTVVRIGAAPPELINQINERFRMLDRKHEGRISYDDIVFGRKNKPRPKGMQLLRSLSSSGDLMKRVSKPREATKKLTTGISNAFVRGLSAISLHSMSSIGPQGYSPRRGNSKVFPVNQGGSEDVECGVRQSKSNVEKFVVHAGSEDSGDGDSICSDTYTQEEKRNKTQKKSDECKSTTMTKSPISEFTRWRSNSSYEASDLDLQNVDDSGENGVQDALPFRGINEDELKSTNATLTTGDQGEIQEPNRFTIKDESSSTELQIADSTHPLSPDISDGPQCVEHRKSDPHSKWVKAKTNVAALRKLKTADNIQRMTKETSVHKRLMFAAYKTLIDPYVQSFMAWFLWLMCGTVFYTLNNDLPIVKGLYLSVSVGYGIFWWPMDTDPYTKAYTTAHLLFGSAAIACAMAAFARSLVNAKSNWYVDAMRKRDLEAAADTEGYWDDIVAAVKFYGPKLKAHILFLVWVCLGVAFGCGCVKWPLVSALYFAVSSMATGGMWPIPDDSPHWYFAFVAVYVCSGVPIMAIAFGVTAHSVATIGGSQLLEDKVNARITDEELAMMKKFGIEDGDGYIDATEFAILILVRIEALPPDLISVINGRFEDLDIDRKGYLSYQELKMPMMRRESTRARSIADAKMAMKNTADVNRRLGFGKVKYSLRSVKSAIR